MKPGLHSLELSRGAIEAEWIEPSEQNAALVFLHEGLGCRALWRGWPARLARRSGLGALIYSRYGYGASTPCDLPRPLTYMQDEAPVLAELLDRLPTAASILVGHSDGASIALIHAGTAPQASLRAVVSIAAHVFCEDRSVVSIAAARHEYDHGDLAARLRRYHGANTETAFRGWNDAWLDPGFRDWNIEDRLPTISVPVLAIQGDDDEYGTRAQLDAIAAAVPQARIATLPGGHWPHRDQAEVCLDLVAAFLKDIRSTDRMR